MSSESNITTRRDFIKAAAAVAALMQGTAPFHASTVLPKGHRRIKACGSVRIA